MYQILAGIIATIFSYFTGHKAGKNAERVKTQREQLKASERQEDARRRSNEEELRVSEPRYTRAEKKRLAEIHRLQLKSPASKSGSAIRDELNREEGRIRRQAEIREQKAGLAKLR